MVNFKKSFRELRKPIIWLHYALGTAGILAVFSFLMKQDINPWDNFWIGALIFYGVYIIVDRAIHGILEI